MLKDWSATHKIHLAVSLGFVAELALPGWHIGLLTNYVWLWLLPSES